jgi:Mitochondrial import 2
MSTVASFDSSSTSSSASRSDVSDDYDDEEYRLAQQEWEEGLQQLQTLVSLVLLPFIGKWMGRKWSHWGEQEIPSSCLTCQLTRFESVCTLSFRWFGEGFLLWW